MTKLAELTFDSKDATERWSEVKDNFWGDLKVQTLRTVKRLLEETMELEIQDLIGVNRGQHSSYRRGYRNGYYSRSLLTGFGWIPQLLVPRVRSGHFKFKSLPHYAQRSKDVDEMILKMFLAGVSTRRIQEVLVPLLGTPTTSSATVSRISKVLDQQVRQFHSRLLIDDYAYLILDAIYLKTKSPVHARRRCILVAYGVHSNGIRELIDFKMARMGESQAAWEGFLVSLKNRGLDGKHLELAVVDGNKGLWNALDLVWLDLPRQRCWAHKLRNAAHFTPKSIQRSCLGSLKVVYQASSQDQAIYLFKRWAKKWKLAAPKAVHCLEQDFEDLIPFFKAPECLWNKLRTTNVIERIFREVRRRTRPMSCFQNRSSVERIIFAIFYRMNDIWMNQPLQITQN